MTQHNPPSRPALRKSVDAAVHPALAGRSGSIGKPSHAAARPSGAAGQQEAAPNRSSAKPPTAPAPSSKPLGKAKRAPTSDALRPSKANPAVKIQVTIPKSLRKQLRGAAKQRGVAAEVLAAQFIVQGLRQR